MITKALILAVILAESGGNPIAQSNQQAEGLMQLTAIAIKEVRNHHDMPEELNIFNPQENITYGVLLLDYYYREAGSLRGALCLYNSGYVGLARYRQGGLTAVSEETRNYVIKITGSYRSYDPMFARILPERSETTYLRAAIDDVFHDVYGVSALSEGIVFGTGLLPLPSSDRGYDLYY